MRIDIISIFPAMFEPVMGESILGRARDKGVVEVYSHDLREWSGNKHRKVDDKPFGGGPGMVMRVEPVVDAVEAVRAMAGKPGRLLIPTPQGRRFSQRYAEELSREERLVFVCGHYEGFDERVFEHLKPEEVSLGDYVLTGGELPVMVIADAVIRLLPGAVGSPGSIERESFTGGLLDYPHYTQPAVWRGLAAPEVLRGGNHALIEAWRSGQALERTRLRRPDIMEDGSSASPPAER